MSQLFALVLCTIISACDDAPRLELLQVAESTLPDTFRPEQAAVGHDGAVALLSVAPAAIAILSNESNITFEIVDAVQPIGVRFVDMGRTTVEVIDAARGVLTRYEQGAPVSEKLFPAPGQPAHAAAAPGGWFVLCESPGELELYWVRGDQWQYLTGLATDSSRVPVYHLGSSGARAIVTMARDPYQILVVDTAGLVNWQRETDRRPRRGGFSSTNRYAYPALLVDDRVVQVVADLQEDAYQVVVYDAVGQTLRTTDLPAPMVMVAELPGRDEILALRNLTGRPEAVVYGWRWTEGRTR